MVNKYVLNMNCYTNLYSTPVVHLNNANFQIVNISIKDKFIDVLNNS